MRSDMQMPRAYSKAGQTLFRKICGTGSPYGPLPCFSKKRLTTLICFLLIAAGWQVKSAAISDDHKSQLKDTIVLGTTAKYPISSEDNSGVLDRFMFEAFKRCGYYLEIIHLPAERSLLDANAGRIDGDLNRIYSVNQQYPNLIRVPEENMCIQFVAVTKLPDIDSVSFEFLMDYDVGVIRGWKIFENNLKDHPGLMRVGSEELLFNLLVIDRADFILYSKSMADQAIWKMGITEMRIVDKPILERPMHVFLHKKHTDLVNRLAETMRAMKKEEEYQDLFKLIK